MEEEKPELQEKEAEAHSADIENQPQPTAAKAMPHDAGAEPEKQPSAEKKPHKQVKHKRKLRVSRLLLLIAVIIAAVFGGTYLKYHQLHSLLQGLPGGLGAAFQDTADPSSSESSAEEKAKAEAQLQANLESKKDDSDLSSSLMNILIVGVDSRDADFTGRSDAMVLCSINENDNRILMTSLLRDTYVAIPGYANNRLNAAFAFGGADLLNETIQKNLGINVDRTVVVNFIFVKEFVDAIGGIDLHVTADEIKVMNNYIRDMNNETFHQPETTDQLKDTEEGTYHLNGKQALAYARDRYSIGSDFDRTSRQRKVIETCMNVVKGKSLTELNSLMEEFLPKIATDLSESDCAKLLLMMFHIGDYKVDAMALPVEGTYQAVTINGMAVISEDFDANYQYWKEALKGNMPGATPSPSASASAEALPTVEISDYTKVPAKTDVALQNQAIAEEYASYYGTSVQYVVDASKQGIFQFYDSSNTMLYPGDTVGKGVIIRYYTSE